MEAVIETFKPVRGYEGLYEVSNCGAVRSLNYRRSGKKYCMNLHKTKGYLRAKLTKNGKKSMPYVHRLVWEAFNSPIPDGYEIDHINTIRDDNRLSNLRVATSKENHANPITAERKREGIRKSRNKPIFQLDKTTGEVIREWECASDVERELGINNANISACCRDKCKSAGGYRWRFASG